MTDAKPDLFAGITQKPLSFGGFEAPSPLFYRDLHMSAALLSANLQAVSDWLPPQVTERFQPLRVLPRRALVAVHCFAYRECDIGPYHEVSLSFALRPRSERSSGCLLRALRSQHFSAWIADLPVTTEIALAGGREVMGYPKRLDPIYFSHGDRQCSMTNFTLQAQALRLRPTRDMFFHTPTVVGGVLEQGQMQIRPRSLGQSLRPGVFMLNEMPAHWAPLELGRVLMALWAPHCQAILSAPAPL